MRPHMEQRHQTAFRTAAVALFLVEALFGLKWKSLETRSKESRLPIMYKIVNQKLAIDPEKHLMKPQQQSRSANTNSCVVLYASTTSRQRLFFPRTIRD